MKNIFQIYFPLFGTSFFQVLVSLADTKEGVGLWVSLDAGCRFFSVHL